MGTVRAVLAVLLRRHTGEVEALRDALAAVSESREQLYCQHRRAVAERDALRAAIAGVIDAGGADEGARERLGMLLRLTDPGRLS